MPYNNLITLFRTRKSLLYEVTKRELGERYVGQCLGMGWVVISPLLLILLYIFVFTHIFKTRSNFFQSESDYIVFFLAGFIPWISLQELMTRSCSVISQNSNLVKQIIFPVEVLPLKIVFVSLFTQLISSFFMFLYIWVTKGFALLHIVFPICVLMQALFMIGLSYILSVIGVYFKDIKDIILFFCSLNIFMSPIFYSEKMVPNILQYVLSFNPFSYLFWCYHDILFYGKIEHPFKWVVFSIISVAVFSFGYKLFSKTKNFFADCL